MLSKEEEEFFYELKCSSSLDLDSLFPLDSVENHFGENPLEQTPSRIVKQQQEQQQQFQELSLNLKGTSTHVHQSDYSQGSSSTLISKIFSKPARDYRQRIASKRYRDKKKQTLRDMKLKLKSLVEENNRLRFEKETVLTDSSKRIFEMNSLKSENFLDEQEKSCIEALKRLQILLENQSNDGELIPVLQTLQNYCNRASQVGQCRFCNTFDSSLCKQFLRLGLAFVLERLPLHKLYEENLFSSTRQLFDFLPCLSVEQRRMIMSTIDTLKEKIGTLSQEREEICKSLVCLWNEQFSIPGNYEYILDQEKQSKAIVLFRKLRQLLYQEARLSDESFIQIIGLMTPKQKAQMFFALEKRRSDLILFKKTWDSITLKDELVQTKMQLPESTTQVTYDREMNASMYFDFFQECERVLLDRYD